MRGFSNFLGISIDLLVFTGFCSYDLLNRKTKVKERSDIKRKNCLKVESIFLGKICQPPEKRHIPSQ